MTKISQVRPNFHSRSQRLNLFGFVVLDRIYFKQYERPLSAISTTFDQDENEYYVVATGRDSDAFETASSGRILVLRMHRHGNENRFALVSQIRTEGMVEQVAAFKGKLVASVHGKVMKEGSTLSD